MYLERLSVISSGNVEAFERLSEQFAQMGRNPEAPGISHLILAKEIYKVALNMTENKHKKVREQLFREAFDQFTLAAAKNVDAA